MAKSKPSQLATSNVGRCKKTRILDRLLKERLSLVSFRWRKLETIIPKWISDVHECGRCSQLLSWACERVLYWTKGKRPRRYYKKPIQTTVSGWRCTSITLKTIRKKKLNLLPFDLLFWEFSSKFSVCTVKPWKIKMQTIQYRKSRIWEMKEDKYRLC